MANQLMITKTITLMHILYSKLVTYNLYLWQCNRSYRFKCHCLPEMKKDILYNICLTMDSIGEILGASCGCPASAGPNGRCKHIAAFTFALEEYCNIRELRSPQSCTSELQKWNQPRKRKLESRSVNDIPFIKHEYGKTKK